MSLDRVYRLREVFSGCEPAVDYALEVFAGDLYGAGTGDTVRMIQLMQLFEVSRCQRSRENFGYKLERSMAHPPTVAEFQELVGALSDLMNSYYQSLVGWLLVVGDSLIGREAFLASSTPSRNYPPP